MKGLFILLFSMVMAGEIINNLLSKYETSNGFTTWAGSQQLGPASGNSITKDALDNLYVFGSTTSNLDSQTNNGGTDLFVVKYNLNGVFTDDPKIKNV